MTIQELRSVPVDRCSLAVVSGYTLMTPTRRLLGSSLYEQRTNSIRQMLAYTSNVSHAGIRGAGFISPQPVSFWVTDDWSDNFYHWMCNVLPKLEFIDVLFKEFKPDIYLPRDFEAKNFVKETISAYPYLNFIFTGKCVFSKISFVQNLSLPQLHISKFVKLISDRFIEHFGIVEDSSHSRLFFVRKSGAPRSIKNEDAVYGLLKEFGFELCEMSELSLRSQIVKSVTAKTIGGPHGANLTCLLFARPGSLIIEIVDTENPRWVHYKNLAQTKQLKYLPFHQSTDGDGRFNVDVHRLGKLLSECNLYL